MQKSPLLFPALSSGWMLITVLSEATSKEPWDWVIGLFEPACFFSEPIAEKGEEFD